MITIPSTLVGVFLGALFSMRMGKELDEDPEYLRRLEAGLFKDDKLKESSEIRFMSKAGLSIFIFIFTTALIILFGSIDSLREINGTMMDMSIIIEVLMLSAAALILLCTKTNGIKAAQGSVFSAGMQAVVAIFGIAWMGAILLSMAI